MIIKSQLLKNNDIDLDSARQSLIIGLLCKPSCPIRPFTNLSRFWTTSVLASNV